MTTVVGLVVKQGDLCYQDKEKFPKGPWCKEGEFVFMADTLEVDFKLSSVNTEYSMMTRS